MGGWRNNLNESGVKTMTKPRSRATLNPTPEQKMARNEGRLSRLPLAIEQAKTPEKKASLQAEYDRRVAELEADIAQKQELLNKVKN